VESEYVTMKQAQDILGVSGFKIWQLVRDGELQAYQSPKDRRRKMIRRSDLEEMMLFQPIDRRRRQGKGEQTDV